MVPLSRVKKRGGATENRMRRKVEEEKFHWSESDVKSAQQSRSWKKGLGCNAKKKWSQGSRYVSNLRIKKVITEKPK